MGKHLYKRHFMTQEDIDYIVKGYHDGTPYKTIAEHIGVPLESISANVLKLKEAGILPNERKKRLKKAPPPPKVGRRPAIREYLTDKAPEKPKGIKCTLAISKTCRYGCTEGTKEKGLCNYILIKHKRRMCDPMDCTEYEKITKETPRYRWAGEEDDEIE